MITIETDALITAGEIVVLFGGVLSVIFKWVIQPLRKKIEELTSPITEIRSELSKHEECLERDLAHLRKLDHIAEYNTELLNLNTEMQLKIIKHLRTKNNTNEMEKCEEKVERWLIDNNKELSKFGK